MSTKYDLLIRGGLIVDGSGEEPFEADVAISGSRIAAVGRIDSTAHEEIDASGTIVTPGFVDIHTHYDGQVTWENRLAPSSDHGVTTVVMGNCGVGFAPCRPHQRALMIKLMEGVEDIPEVVMQAGVPFDWETFPQYLDALDKRHADIDFGTQIPHSPLRVFVMGQRGADREPPTDDDLSQMRRLTTEAIRAGALGVTTSRNLAHRFRNGNIAPSVRMADEEVLALADGLHDAGTGVFQMVPDTDVSADEQLDLLRNVAMRSGRPVSFTLIQHPTKPDDWRTLMSGIEAAADAGMDIRGQVLPRPTGNLMGLALSLHPFAFNPSYRAIAHLPLAERVRQMRAPEMRRRLLAEQPADPHPFFMFVISEKEMLFVLGDPPNYNPSAEQSIAARARALNIDPMELIYDSLLERDGNQILYRPMGNISGESFEGCGTALLDKERTVLGLGDGGAHYGMICDAAYPTYFLTYWSRDASPERRIPLHRAIRMLSRRPALTVGLGDRGLVQRGYKADLNIIDLDRLHLHAPSVVYDLPASGRRIVQKSDGYAATIVSGVVTYRNGAATGALPGRLLRGAQPMPA